MKRQKRRTKRQVRRDEYDNAIAQSMEKALAPEEDSLHQWLRATGFNTASTVTGRFSSSEPNLISLAKCRPPAVPELIHVDYGTLERSVLEYAKLDAEVTHDLYGKQEE